MLRITPSIVGYAQVRRLLATGFYNKSACMHIQQVYYRCHTCKIIILAEYTFRVLTIALYIYTHYIFLDDLKYLTQLILTRTCIYNSARLIMQQENILQTLKNPVHFYY